MSKKNKSNKKKSTRGKYKIEALEPRLMMDGDPTIKNWCDDIEKFSDEYSFPSSSYKHEEIDGLFVAKEDSLEQATYGTLLEIRAKAETWQFFSKDLEDQMQEAVNTVKTDLIGRIRSLHVDSIETPAAEIVAKLGSEEKTIPTGLSYQTTTYGIELFEGDKIKVNFFVNLEISSVPGLGYVNEVSASVLNKLYKADSSEILGLEADYQFRRYSELYQASFILDGNALNGVDKESSLSLMVEFNEKAGDSAKYGVLEFNGDSDSDADLVLGAKITKTATDTLFENFSKADFDFSIKNPEQFSDNASEYVFKNESSVILKKDFADASAIWSDSSIEKYNDITMGKILGKLQELSSAITNTLSLAKNRVDFGEFLSQNVNELICVSDMLKDVLNACPQSIQELIEVINKSDYSVNKNVVVCLDEQGNLVIPFNLKYIEYERDDKGEIKRDDYSGNKIIKSDYVNAVTISKNKIESLFKGLDVYVNGGVNIKSSASMSFNLVVPFAESSKAETDTELIEIGLDGDDSQIGSMLGDKAIIGSCMNRMYEGYTLNNRASSVAGKDGYCLYQSLDKSHVYYAVYCDNDDSKNIDVSGLAEFQEVKVQRGFVLNWNTKCKQIFYSGKRVHVESLEEAVDALNVIFSNNSNFGENTRAIAFNHNIVVLFDGTPEQMTYLNKGENLNIDEVSEDYDEDNLKKIWISQEIKPELFNNEIKITVTKPSESKGVEIVFEEGYFNNASCVADIAVSIQDRINKCFGWGEYSVKDCNPIELYVETFEGKIRFCTSKSYKIDFGTDLVAKWLGFSSKELDFGNSTAVKKNSICVNIKVTGVAKPIPCEVDLSDLVGKDASRKTITVQQLLDRIVSSVNDHLSALVHKRVTALEQDGIELKISSSYQNFYSIDSIEDINGYSIASLLGLSGKSKSVDKNAGRNRFEIDSVIKEIYQNEKDVVKLEEFNLTIDSCVDSSKDSYNLTGNYGVFGVEINESMAGHSCKTTCTLGEDNLLNENNEITVSPKYIIRSSKTNLVSHGVCVSRNDALSGDLIEDENLGMFQKTTISGMEKSIVLLNNWSLETPSDFMKYYGPNSLTMDVLYDGLYNVVSKDLMKVFFDGDDPKFLESLELPLQGKSVLDLMGLRGKINEMAKCLNQGNGSTLQELKAFFAQNLGVVLNFKLSSTGLGIDIDWTKTIQNQATELGGMDFGLGDFNLGGSVEAYLNLDLTLHTHIDIAYNDAVGGFTTTLLKDVNNTYIKGSVHLSAENIVSDLNVCVAETDSENQKTTYEKLFQIGDKDGNHSHLFMEAFVNVADSSVPGPNGETLGSRQAVAIYIGGKLYTSRYGMDAGVITIGVAKNNDDYKILSCWDNDDNPESLAKQLGIWCEDGQILNSVAVWDRDCDGKIYKTDEIKACNLVVDLTELTEPLNETFLFEKLRQVADGLSDTLRRLQSNLNGVLSKKNVRSIPLLGDSILGAADCLTDLYTTLVEPFRKYVSGKYGGFDANSVAQNLYTMLVGKLDKLGTPSTVEKWAGVDFTKSYKDYIQYCESDDEVCWRMRLVGHYNLEKNKGFDLGFAGLGLKTEGGVDIDLEWTLDIGFGISKKDGAFLLLSTGRESDEKAVAAEHTIDEKGRVVTKEHAGDDFNLKLTIKPNLDLKGSLGFLAMNGHLDKDKSSFELDLGIDLNDGDNSYESVEDDWVKDQYAKEKISFSGIKSGLSVEAGLRGGVNIDLKTSLGIGGYTKEAPHIEANVVLNWSAERGTSEFGKLTEFAFRDIVFDAGAFVNNTIGNIVDKINKTIDPIRPLINFLQSEIPVLNKLPAGCFRITVLDLVKKYGESKGMNFGFLDDLIELTNVVKKFEAFKNEGIKITNDWVLVDNSGSVSDERKSLNERALQYLNGKVSNINDFVEKAVAEFKLTDLSFVNKMAGFSDSDPSDYLSKLSSKWNVSESKLFDSIATPTFSADWTFPLFEKDSASKEIMKLLMGGHADLIVMDMAPLQFKFDWSKSFPIVGPLCADIGFGFGVSIDLCFGYDTYGLESWSKSGFKNATALLNGFYISDWDESENDVAEIVFRSSITAGASVCGRAGINVGLNMNLNLDFIDPNYDGKIRLSEMADMLSFNPLDTFDISASMEVTAYAYLDYFIGRKEWTLWSSGAIELFSTASKTRDPVVYTYIGDSNQEDTVVNVGEYAEYRSTGYVGDLPDVVDIAFTDAHNAMISLGYTAEDGNDYTYATTNPTCTVKGNLYVYAGDGADKIIVKGTNICHNIIVYGGEGDDVIDLSQASFAAGYYAILMGGAGDDSIFGAATGVNYVFGDEGILLYQRKSNIEEEKKLKEILVYPSESSSGNNTIIGGCKANNVIFGGFGSDTIWGGAKEDYIFGDGGRFTVDSYVASAYDLFDEGGSDVIYGLDSNDFICAGAGDDFVKGGDGTDIIYAGQGDDTIHGGSGNDFIYGNDGVDVIFGDTPSNEEMVIVTKNNTAGVMPYAYASRNLTEDAKLDEVKTRSVLNDSIEEYTSSREEMKTLYSQLGFEWSTLENAVKVKVTKGMTAEAVAALNLNDTTYDEFFKDEFRSQVKKYVNGTGKTYSDVIDGGNGSDVIFGDDGAKQISGNDDIKGGAGNDFIDGDNGDDVIDGGTGDDIIYGGLGSDTLDGGADNDIVMGDDGWNAESSKSGYQKGSKEGSWFAESRNDTKKIFGDTIEAFSNNFGLNENSVSKSAGGDDIIITGSGNDIVDGQSGNDTYKVNFKGEYYSAYTNILESGDDAADSMVVNGTIWNDDILVRASDDGLGLIALLPNEDTTKNDDNSNKKRIERINYRQGTQENGGVERVSINTGAGNDKIAVDSSLSTLDVDAGAGNDTITIGQLYKSKRVSDENTKILSLDGFDGKTIETTEGYLSDGANFASSFNGGDGNDVFNMLHTSAAISLIGGAGNDNFNIASYSVEKNGKISSLKNAPVSVMGGAGNDTMTVNGTEDDDKFVYTNGTVYAPNLDIQSVGIENQNANGGNGDDEFYVLDTPKGAVYQLNGNNGNDSFYNGGAQVDENTPNVIDLKPANQTDQNQENINVIFVGPDNKESRSLAGTISENDGTFEYGIKLSKAPKAGETVCVTIFAPVVFEENHQRGDKGILFADGENYTSFVTLTFDSSDYSTVKKVQLKAFADKLSEGDAYFALLHKVQIEGNTVTSKVNDCKNVLVFMDDKNSLQPKNAFTETLEHRIGKNEHSFDVHLNALPLNSDITIWTNSHKKIEGLKWDRVGNKLTVEWTNDLAEGTIFYINYSHNSMVVENTSVLQMKYNAQESLKNNKIYLAIRTNDSLLPKYDSDQNECSYEYDINAKKLDVHRGTMDQKQFNLSGFLYCMVKQPIASKTVNFTLPLLEDGISVFIKNEKDEYEKVSYVLSEDQTTLELDTSSTTIEGYITYATALEINGASTDRDVISLWDKLNGLEFVDDSYTPSLKLDENYEVTSQRNASEEGYFYKTSGNQLIICSNKTGKPVTVSGTFAFYGGDSVLVANEKEENELLGDMPESITVSKNTIENILGSVYENGAGDMNDFASSPMMLRYKELNKSDDKKEIDEPSEADKKRMEELAKKMASFDETKSIDRVFMNNMDNSFDATSSLTALKKGNAVDAKLLASDSQSVRFTHTDHSHKKAEDDFAKNISFGNMEYGEINLGTGEDTVDISKSIYREDGFQTFTVVNSGKGVDTINVNSYKAEQETLICEISKQFTVSAKVLVDASAQGNTPSQEPAVTLFDKYTYILTAENENVNELPYDVKAIANKNGKVYLVALFSDGVERRAEVDVAKTTVNSIALHHAFDGISDELKIVSARFAMFQGSDDQLVINAGEGDDHVFATNENVKKKGLIVFGGLGDDEIEIKSESSVVFGDRGQVLYHDAKGNVVTRLGDDKTGTFIGKENGAARNAGGSDYATGKKKGDEAYYQTDGTRYGASIARTVTEEQGGNDTITLGGGRNVVFGGENKNEVIDKDEKLVVSKYGIDNITTGNGDDFILGDNGYTTFQGRSDVAKGLDMENVPTIYEESTISFNFQGDAQNGFEANDSVGAPGYESKNWVNIKGSLASTYGNDDSEIVRFDNGTRASAISLSYNGNEDLRFSSSDNAINLQTYNHWLSNRDQDNAAKLMNSGLMSTAPNNQNGNKVNVAIDGLAQYYESYKVVVYLDLPDANSWEHQSVRIVSLFIDGKREQAYYVNDPAPENFKGSFENHAVRAILNSDGSIKGVKRIKDKDGVEVETVEPIDDEFGRAMLYSNYVVFDVGANIASDRIVIRVEDGIQDPNYNGKDIPGIAAIQIKGVHHKQDVAATTNIDFGGRDVIHSGRGDDIVAGGTDADTIETFGDDHRGIDDNDIVFGDNAKMVFVDRDNNVETASMISSAESIAVKNLGVSYNDVIDTGDGNDTIVGGVGQDTIHSGATAAAEDMQDGVKALSINFTRDDADDSMKIREATYETKIVEGEVKFVYDGHGKKVIKTSGETAGVVADNDWHNMYVKNRELHEFADYSSHTVDGVDVAISSYGNPWQEYWADNASMTNNISDELDGDTSNSKLYHNYLAAQKQEEIKLTLDHLDTFRSHNGLKSGAYCDLYVYLGGDNNDVHIYDHIYDISLTWYDKSGNKCKTEHRFLNDWTGYNFDGDYKEAYCTSYTEAVDMLHKDSAVCVRIIGNYVVFHNISVDKVDVRIKNVYTHTRGNQNPNENGEQNPKNLPLINAVQIVAGSGKEDAAIGGDHDKDLVFGDDAKLTFDIDVPYAVDEKMADYKNRVVEAESVAIADNVVKKLSTEDIIDTGKDRDVVVGGEGSDNITTGSGDDIAIGGSANLMVEHNNPLGVFTPSVEIVLDQHTIDTNNHQGYLDHHCNNPQEAEQAVRDFQGLLDQGQIKGIQIIDNKNDRLNTFDLGEERDLQSTGSNDPSELVNQNDDEEQNGNQGSENPVINEDDQIDYDKTVISPVACAQLNLVANEKVKLVLESYPKSDDYTPNLWVFVSPQVPGQSFEDVCIELYSDGKLFSYDIEGGFWKSQDVPDHIDGDPTFKDGNCVVYVSSKVNTNVTVQVAEGG